MSSSWEILVSHGTRLADSDKLLRRSLAMSGSFLQILVFPAKIASPQELLLSYTAPWTLAKFITQEELRCPAGIERESWTEAVTGRILHLKLSRPHCPHTWHLIGLYQHVASPEKSELRRWVLSSVAEIIEGAKNC
jgi:hypothetical protein